MTVQFYRDQIRDDLRATADAIWAELRPPLNAIAEELHVTFFELKPWWARWWHTITGHRNGRMLP